MNEYAPEYLFPALAVIVAGVGWYCYRWGRADGYARGRAYAMAGDPVAPSLPGGQVAPLGGGGPGVPEK